MKEQYKPFSQQLRECKASGNLVEIKCSTCPQINLVCLKYGKQCMSSVCRDERIQNYIGLCPECNNPLRAKELNEGGGIVCTNPKCDYWFCY